LGQRAEGEFLKMMRTGIEYRRMQAYGEGFDILRGAGSQTLPVNRHYQLDVTDIAQVWRHGSGVASGPSRSRGKGIGKTPSRLRTPALSMVPAKSRGAVFAAIEEAVPAEVLSAAIYARFRWRDQQSSATSRFPPCKTNLVNTFNRRWTNDIHVSPCTSVRPRHLRGGGRSD